MYVGVQLEVRVRTRPVHTSSYVRVVRVVPVRMPARTRVESRSIRVRMLEVRVVRDLRKNQEPRAAGAAGAAGSGPRAAVADEPRTGWLPRQHTALHRPWREARRPLPPTVAPTNPQLDVFTSSAVVQVHSFPTRPRRLQGLGGA